MSELSSPRRSPLSSVDVLTLSHRGTKRATRRLDRRCAHGAPRGSPVGQRTTSSWSLASSRWGLLWAHGVSTRTVDDLVKALGIDAGISKSEVSRISAELDEH